MFPPPSQNTVGVCNHVCHLLILYYISSRLVTLPKIVYAPVQSLIFLMLFLVSGLSVLSFGYSFFVPEICYLTFQGWE